MFLILIAFPSIYNIFHSIYNIFIDIHNIFISIDNIFISVYNIVISKSLIILIFFRHLQASGASRLNPLCFSVHFPSSDAPNGFTGTNLNKKRENMCVPAYELCWGEGMTSPRGRNSIMKNSCKSYATHHVEMMYNVVNAEVMHKLLGHVLSVEAK